MIKRSGLPSKKYLEGLIRVQLGYVGFTVLRIQASIKIYKLLKGWGTARGKNPKNTLREADVAIMDLRACGRPGKAFFYIFGLFADRYYSKESTLR